MERDQVHLYAGYAATVACGESAVSVLPFTWPGHCPNIDVVTVDDALLATHHGSISLILNVSALFVSEAGRSSDA